MPVVPVESFVQKGKRRSERNRARVTDPTNGNELLITSEGYEHSADAIHALVRGAKIVMALLQSGQLEDPYP